MLRLLNDILKGAEHSVESGSLSAKISNVAFDSRNVIKGSLFVAIKGTQSDGHAYISSAIEKGATAIVCEDLPGKMPDDITFIKVPDSSSSLGIIAANFYDNPTDILKLIGVTGTNGKTSIVTLLYHLFRGMGYKCGLISTIRVLINDREKPATHTTPDPVQLNSYFAEMVKLGCEYCFMEVSSHAIHQHRIAGLNFRGGIFTNITRDHLDYHVTFDNYLNAKKSFFDQLTINAFALVNSDDKHSKVMIQNCAALKKTYGLKNNADFKTKIIESDLNGMHLQMNGHEFYTNRVGNFNASNLTAVYGTASLLGVDEQTILTGMSIPVTVQGRFEILHGSQNIIGIVDYAHTPDALENVLSAIHEVNTMNGRIITVFGCGGNRDKGKRPMMGKIAAELSDMAVITSDNPRFEDPELIISEIEKGVDMLLRKKTLSITDRENAIKTACRLAQPNDIILVAGKGHENYQEINGVKIPFDDKIVLSKYLKD
jgi:UDP-N-acetylmuramoyl-L-alanyl-D-glutamate--2,6-diaminopimelate ligase